MDGKDNVWLGGNQGNTVLKFTRQGKFLMQIGKNGQSKGNADIENLGRPAKLKSIKRPTRRTSPMDTATGG